MNLLNALDRCAAVEADGVKPDVWIEAGPFITITQIPGGWSINGRGSKTYMDWLRDFFAVPVVSLDHPTLGLIPAGFYLGMEAARAAVNARIGGAPRMWTGHSLAGAEAGIGAMLDHLDGLPVLGCAAFEPPKWASPRVCEAVKALPWPYYISHAHGDVVPDMPHAYRHATAEAWVGVEGELAPMFKDPFYWHHLVNIRPFVAAQGAPT